MSAGSYVGTILDQFGTLAGAKVFIDGVDVTPTDMKPITPRRIGRNGLGRPFYQGDYQWELHYTEATLDEYQRLAVIWYAKLNTFAGPKVSVVLPWHDQAGRFVQGTAYMEWPQVDRLAVLIDGVTVLLTSFRVDGDA